MKKIGFIGMGNMARAIAGGFAAAGVVRPEDMFAYAPRQERLKDFCASIGMNPCRTVFELLDQVDTVIMAVKPYVVEGVLSEIHDALRGKAMLSVVAGYTCEKYRPLVDESVRVQYIMPNTPCLVGAGMLLFEQQNTLFPDELEQAISMFRAVGEIEILPTRLMDPAMGISGCGPAFMAMVIEALGDAGVKYGLPRATAYRLAAQTMLGTGRMHLETGMHPGVIKDGVCSPAGTTIKGVEALETCGVRHAFMEAVKATMEG